jgi:starch phosphorylase
MEYKHPEINFTGGGKKTAYFCMEYAIDEALHLYSGGLGFLAGSHLRSAYDLNKNFVAVGILWKSGYYDQERGAHNHMRADFVRRDYDFLQDTGIRFTLMVNHAPVYVKALFLPPDTFGSAPLYLLSTDLPENDYLAHTIVDRLYAPDNAAKIAQSMLLGIGGGMLLDRLGIEPEVYHLNEGHGLPLAFYLLDKFKNPEEVKKRLVFTTHTPERAGNEEHPMWLLSQMGFFHTVPEADVRKVLQLSGDSLNYTVTALQFSRIANGVSAIHGKVSQQLWGSNRGVCNIISITNAQNAAYWTDGPIRECYEKRREEALLERKKELKKQLFRVVQEQTGKQFDPEVLTIVWARRFAGYKRADLLIRDQQRFLKLINNPSAPVQVIWAGKPYPEDQGGTAIFNGLVDFTQGLKQCTVLTGYELALSAILKKGADVWLNTPRYPREASGTSGMTAAMNAAVNLSVADGWYPEFAKDKINGFVIPVQDTQEYFNKQDDLDHGNLMQIVETEIIPSYYQKKEKWMGIIRQSMQDIVPYFDSGRMVQEYYDKMYE